MFILRLVDELCGPLEPSLSEAVPQISPFIPAQQASACRVVLEARRLFGFGDVCQYYFFVM